MNGGRTRPTEAAHRLIRSHVRPGDIVVDATAGNGHDTLFLANCVGTEGTVHGFDIQSQAIEKTAERTANLPQVRLHHLGHEQIRPVVDTGIAAAMFNLGYLPSGDKSIITLAETTLRALEGALTLLAPGGLITVVVYPGHEGGQTEADAITEWIASRNDKDTAITNHRSPEAPSHAPYLLEIRKAN